MPNMCENQLEIITEPVGGSLDTDRLRTALLDDEGDLSFAVSVPSTNGEKDWGTKWNAVDPETSITDTLVISQFGTANKPPLPWLKVVSGLFPEVTVRLQYVEPGEEFSGQITVIAGEVTEDTDDEGFVPMLFRMLSMHPNYVEGVFERINWDADLLSEVLDSGRPIPEQLRDLLVALVREDDEFEGEARTDFEARLIAHPVGPVSDLERLIDSDDWKERAWVAGHPKTTMSMFQRLAQDENSEVRDAAQQTVLKKIAGLEAALGEGQQHEAMLAEVTRAFRDK